MKKYSWDKRTFGVKADVVGAVFEELEEQYGGVTPENFLNASRLEDSPTHKLFEWNNEKAAENYRLHQSRTVINNIRIEMIVEDRKFKVPAYVNVSSKNDGSAKYQYTPRVFEAVETRDIVLERAKRELEMFRIKYEKFEELANVITAINQLRTA